MLQPEPNRRLHTVLLACALPRIESLQRWWRGLRKSCLQLSSMSSSWGRRDLHSERNVLVQSTSSGLVVQSVEDGFLAEYLDDQASAHLEGQRND